jgi:acyl-CoA thioesterase-2
MSKGLIDLISILDIEPLEVNLFRGNSPKTSWQRVFGGQVIGQAMVAACRTVEGRLPHSLHCYFILPGDPQIPIIYEVERLRDGKSYSTRRVTAIQHGNAIFSIMVSFHVEEQGSFDHQDKMPDVPPPEKLTAEEVAKQPMFREMPDFIRRYYESDRPIELRPVELGRYFGQKIDDGEPRPCNVVSPAVPRRRMAALCPGLAERTGRTRTDPRHDLQAGRHAGGLGRAGRLASRTQVIPRVSP